MMMWYKNGLSLLFLTVVVEVKESMAFHSTFLHPVLSENILSLTQPRLASMFVSTTTTTDSLSSSTFPTTTTTTSLSPWRRSHSSSSTFLFMAGKRRSGGGGGGGGKKRLAGGGKKKLGNNNKKTKMNNKKKSNTRSNSKQSPFSNNDNPTEQHQQQQQQQRTTTTSSSHSPPWKIVSKKDMSKNIKAEKKRRSLAKEQGIHLTPAEIDNERKDFTLSTSFLDPADKALVSWKPFSISRKKFDDIEYIGSYLDRRLPPRLGVPEIAFLGRSNVGKSSLLNVLVGTDIARVGKTPGATASVNLYSISTSNKKSKKNILGLVDLPGFGYAKLSKESKESVQVAAEYYLNKRKELVLGILLVDSRRIPSDDDRAVLAALYDIGRPIIVVATKVDKLSPSTIDKSLEQIRVGLGLPQGQPLCISSVTGRGIKDLWKIILESCEMGIEEYRDTLLRQSNINSSNDDEDEMMMINNNNNEFDDGYDDEYDDDSYSQGYDWIHDSAIMYEGDDDRNYDSYDVDNGFDNSDGEYYYYDKHDDDDNNNDDDNEDGYNNNNEKPHRFSMKELKKQARKLERGGNV